MKKFFSELTSKIVISAAASIVGGYLYEQARKVGKKSQRLVDMIEEWDRKVH